MKVVQIGVGGWGKNHSRVLSEFGVLSAVCDTNSQRAKEFGKKYSVNSYDSFESLLEHEEFDAALVCTPTFTHSDITKRLIENKKHVFVEKPMTYLSEDGQNLIDAAKRASAGRISAVIPYFPYGRTDKKDQPRVPITARLVADLITVSGADRILTLDLHAGQIQGFFNIPVDELTASSILATKLQSVMSDKDNSVVVATDLGGAKIAREVATILNHQLP